jgi:methanogenic corrinoid protein MtbC1
MEEVLPRYIMELKRDEVLAEITRRLDQDHDPAEILDQLRRGLTMVGNRYQEGEYFLAELMLSGEIFKKAMNILEPRLATTRPSRPVGKVIMATMRGDIHDLGKNIVGNLLRAQNFEVYDLGVDIAPDFLVSKVREIHPDFVGFSALITLAFDSMKEAADILENDGLRKELKIMIGGGVTTPQLMDYVGADFQTVDATDGVEYCLSVVGGK